MRILISFCFLLLTSIAFAEIIDGPANLRVAPGGKVAISMNDEVEVYVEEKVDNYFKIIFLAYVSKKDYRATKFINGGIELFDFEGKSIGKTVDSFSNFEYFEDPDRFGLVITLYTYKSNIVESSILESEIVELLNSNQLNRSSLSNLGNLKIDRWTLVEGFSGGVVFDVLTNPFSPGIRFIFFVQNQEIVAIAGNDKMKVLEFECLGMAEIKEQGLNVFYLKEQVFSRREAFEKSLYVALSKMH